MQFLKSVRNATLQSDVNVLQIELPNLEFCDVDAFLIASAVSLTRNLPLPSLDSISDELQTLEFRTKLVDSLGVTFMFNVVNRIANLYELQPEWNRLRPFKFWRRLTQAIMSIGLPWQMPLYGEEQTVELPVNTTPLLSNFGIATISPAWQCFELLPTVNLAIYQLLLIAIEFSESNQPLIQQTMQECIEPATYRTNDEALAPGQLFWRQLYSEPWRVSGGSSIGCIANLSQRSKLDTALWISLTAGVHQLNSSGIGGVTSQ